jgi:hypothetical protein
VQRDACLHEFALAHGAKVADAQLRRAEDQFGVGAPQDHAVRGISERGQKAAVDDVLRVQVGSRDAVARIGSLSWT